MSTKKIKISYDTSLNTNKFKYKVDKVDENRIELTANTNEINIGELLSYFTSVGNIVDIQIEATPLEDVIKKIYKERRKV